MAAVARPRMRRWQTRFGLFAVLGAIALGGCATDDREADAFFRRGWLWPKNLDKPYEPPPPSDDSAPLPVAPGGNARPD